MMRQTALTLFNRRVGDVLIAGAFVLLSIFLALNLSTPTPESVPVSGPSEPSPWRARVTTSTVFDAEAFKKTIIDNNLFRPLGWTRRVPAPAYRLTGTLIPRDSKTPPQALILATANHKTHIVIPGDKLAADTTVIEIRSKHVILERGGQRITLKLDTSAWLHTSKRRFSRPK